jgi:enediyne biosynthesis protein E4
MRAMSPRLGALGLALAGLSQGAAAEQSIVIPKFVEETKSAGIDSVYAGGWQYMVGGGVATFDCSGNGSPDMLLAGGETPAKFYRNTSPRGGPLHFELQKSGLELDKVIGAYPLDIDGDGITDVVLLRVGEIVLMRGLGDCKFERANEKWGFNGGNAWWTSFSATWERGADWPTLAFGSYIDPKREIDPWGSCTDNWLYRPKVVDGKTERQFDAPLALKPSYCALSMLFTDWNRSGTPSLRISNDREYYRGGEEQLWHIEPGKPPTPYTEAEGWKPLKIWGMGIASYDLTGAGYPDYFLSSMADNKLQTLTRTSPGGPLKPDYKDVAFAKNAIAQHPYTGGDVRPSTAWHAQFEDVNNDGLVDLFITKGNVSDMPDFAAADPNDLLLQDSDGKFHEVGDKAGIASMAGARGAALADFNLDGLPDLVVVNRGHPAQIWRNVTENAGHWLEVRLRQDGANRDAIGSWLEVRRGPNVMRREITVGGGHASGQLGWWHFGLADASEAEVRVIWPDGADGGWQRVDSNNFYILERGKPAQLWTAK